MTAVRNVPTSGAVQPALGRALRAVREQQRLSLQHVAAATAVSASFLSMVENGKNDITLGRLTRLIDFYRVSLTDLLPPNPAAQLDVVRSGAGTILRSTAEGIDFSLLTPDTNRTILPMLLKFAPDAELEEPGQHEGEEWVHVLSGTLRLTVEGSDPRVLGKGDSAYYAADQPHRFANHSTSKPLILICVDSPSPL